MTSQWTENLKSYPITAEDKTSLCMDNKENAGLLNMPSPSLCILYLSKCAVNPGKKKKRLILAPPILYGALSPLLLHCMSLEPREASVAQRLDSTDGCIQQWGKQNQQTPAHFDTNILIHASTCIQIHNQTRCHSNILLCICTVYPLCIVSDAVICMLICRWSVTIIH